VYGKLAWGRERENRRHFKSRGLLFYEKGKENNRFGTGFFYTTE